MCNVCVSSVIHTEAGICGSQVAYLSAPCKLIILVVLLYLPQVGNMKRVHARAPRSPLIGQLAEALKPKKKASINSVLQGGFQRGIGRVPTVSQGKR